MIEDKGITLVGTWEWKRPCHTIPSLIKLTRPSRKNTGTQMETILLIHFLKRVKEMTYV